MKILSLVFTFTIISTNILSPNGHAQESILIDSEQDLFFLLQPVGLQEIASHEELSEDPSETIIPSEEPPILVIAKIDEPSTKADYPIESAEANETISDPLEPINRIFFHFNDRLYFWVLKPVATGYKKVVPEDLRIGIRNFFSNLTTPIRVVNCLLQFNFKCVGTETFRFLLNSTLGLAGFLDPAKKELGIEKKDEDFGQTLGFWGMGSIFYIEWPILGASCLRDTIGYVGDLFLDPQNYLITSIPVNLAVRSYERVNDTSLRIGEYEDFLKVTVDPYIAKRDAYYQNRKHKIRER